MTLPMLNGRCRTYTEWGGYPIFYLDHENNVVCADCATDHLDDEIQKFRPCVADVNWESDIWCDHCSAEIESVYEKVQERIDRIND